MKKSLVTPAAELPVTLADAKAWSVVEHTADDAVVNALITNATDMAQQYLGRKLVTQTWDYFFDCFPSGCIEIDCIPGQSVTHVKYYDADDVEQTLAGSEYYVDEKAEPRLLIKTKSGWPAVGEGFNRVSVQVVAGYGVADDVPEPIKTGIKLLVGHLYRNREATAPIKLEEVPMGIKMHWNPYRVIEL